MIRDGKGLEALGIGKILLEENNGKELIETSLNSFLYMPELKIFSLNYFQRVLPHTKGTM